MEAKLSSRMTMSPASRATSVPLPMAKPTSASFRAGASLMPSPVMPATSPRSWAARTRRLLSDGSARATTRSFGRAARSFSSLRRPSSSLVRMRSPSWAMPASMATARAVRRLSPVIMTVWMPALRTWATASRTPGRRGSRMASRPTSVRGHVSGSPDPTASSSTRMARSVSRSMVRDREPGTPPHRRPRRS